jgi:hypothetical protein
MREVSVVSGAFVAWAEALNTCVHTDSNTNSHTYTHNKRSHIHTVDGSQGVLKFKEYTLGHPPTQYKYMLIYIYIYIYIYYSHTHTHTQFSIKKYIAMSDSSMHRYVHTRIHIYVSMHSCIMHVCMHVHIDVNTHIHTYTYNTHQTRKGIMSGLADLVAQSRQAIVLEACDTDKGLKEFMQPEICIIDTQVPVLVTLGQQQRGPAKLLL